VRRRPTFGILVDWLENEYQNTVLVGLEETARAKGADLLCFAGGELRGVGTHGGVRNFVFDLAGPHTVDGVVLLGGTIGNAIGAAELERYCERFRPLPLCTIGIELPGIPSVLVDNARGMHALLDHLIGMHGHSRIAFVRGPAASAEANSRYATYAHALEEHGIAVDPALVVEGDFERASGAWAVRELLDARRVRFDAIVAASDPMAQGAIDALESRGLRVPFDVAVAGFDDIESARFAAAPLTTVRQPLREQGVHAIETLLAASRGTAVELRKVLRSQLVVRKSCGCPIQALPSTAGFSVIPPGGPIHHALRAHRSVIVQDMARSTRAAQGLVENAWGERLVEALAAELEGGHPGLYLATVEEILLTVMRLGGRIPPWNAALAAVRHHARAFAALAPPMAGRDATLRVDELAHESFALLSLLSERAEAQRRLAADRTARALRALAEELATSVELTTLPDTLARHLPELRIKSFHLVLLDERADSPLGHYLGGLDASGRAALRGGVSFPWREILPDAHRNAERRTSFVVEPLYSEGEPLGYLLLEMGSVDGVVFEALRDQLSGALRSTLLFQQLTEEGARRRILEREREVVEQDLASRIQTAALPDEVTVGALSIAAGMLPAEVPGGDYYDVLPHDDGCWIAMGDVAGHGLATSVVALVLRSTIAALAARSSRTSPSEILKTANGVLFETVRHRLREDLHAAATLLRVEAGGRMVFSGAHEEILICRARDGRCAALPTPGTWLGAVRDVTRAMVDTEYLLEPGDLLVLFTDGLIEAKNAAGVVFGAERLKQLVESLRGAPAPQVRDEIFSEVRRWAEHVEDDISVLVARYSGATR
jgi:DNA-binding LacI/PurR family transcriptional regulator/serine phosphatase RsbU (regulator of sigma subunit)